MIKYLHIGYPKNFSTSLQRDFFSIHPEIYHLGVGAGSNIAYRDDFLSAIFEVYLKFSKCFKYKESEEKIKAHLDYHCAKAIKEGKNAFGISSEHISFSFTYDCLDFQEKMRRVVSLFGRDLKIIVIIRGQIDLIKSLYKESVRVGFPGNFNDYLHLLYKFQDRNYYYDLRYDLVFESLCRFVDKRNIHFLTFESYRDANKSMILDGNKQTRITNDLCKILGVNFMDVNFEHHNEALSDSVVKIKAELNKANPHDLGNHLYSSAEAHRQAAYFLSELGLREDEQTLFKDVVRKRDLIEKASRLADTDETTTGDLFSCDLNLKNTILKFYKIGNQKFSKITGIQLPETYY